jgi:hypothetical protein
MFSLKYKSISNFVSYRRRCMLFAKLTKMP